MIIVTGASRGLGSAIAKRLVESGENVVGLARSAENLDFEGINCDVSDYESLKGAYREIKKKDLPIKAVVNAAGVASMNLALTTSHSSVQKTIQTNLVGTISVCQLFAPIMVRQSFGSFINFSTIAVPLALSGESIYSASKAGVENFSRTFAREVAEFGIRVNCIAPGPIKTDLLRGVSETQINKIISRQILKRQFGKEDVCDVVELLLDDKAKSITGQVLSIGGV